MLERFSFPLSYDQGMPRVTSHGIRYVTRQKGFPLIPHTFQWDMRVVRDKLSKDKPCGPPLSCIKVTATSWPCKIRYAKCGRCSPLSHPKCVVIDLIFQSYVLLYKYSSGRQLSSTTFLPVQPILLWSQL